MPFPLPEREYHEQFLIALAMAIHCKVIEPAELTYFLNLENDWSQMKIAKELFKRVKSVRV